MRITIVNQFYSPDISPTARLSASLGEHLAEQGHEVTVVASRGGYVPQSAEKGQSTDENPRVCRIWTPRLGKASSIRRCIDWGCFYILAMLRIITLRRQDIIISLTTPPYIVWASLIHKVFHHKTKAVLWNMDCYPEVAERSGKLQPNGVLSRIMRFMNRMVFKRLDHLICLDKAMVDLLCPQYSPKDHTLPVSVIPNWERADQYTGDVPREIWDGVEKYSLNGKFVILYMGNAGYGHEFGTVLDAAERLRDDSVAFLFVGGGARWKMIEEEKENRQLDNVILHEYVPSEEVQSVMACAQCSLITLRDVILGVMSPSKLHANLAMGLPIIYVGPVGSNVDDAIERFGCGVSIRHERVDEFVEYIRTLIETPESLNELKKKARGAFEQAYCDMQTLTQFDAVINSLDDTVEKKESGRVYDG